MSKFTEGLAAFAERHKSLYAVIAWAENQSKAVMFHCQHCGQCVLSQNAFICPMRCPKQLRNGPCGGTRADGHCEVYPERLCVWWWIYMRSKKMGSTWKLKAYHIPVDRRFQNTSAWMNMFAGRILPLSFCFRQPKTDQEREACACEERKAKKRECAMK